VALANNETIRTLVIVVRLALIVVGGSYNLAADPLIRARSSSCAEAVNVWTENILFSFNGADGWWPVSSLIFDQQGNL
jgi:hypothetical protein